VFTFEKLEVWHKAVDLENEYRDLYAAAETQGKMLSGLRRSLTES
jgi:hypothetical protein